MNHIFKKTSSKILENYIFQGLCFPELGQNTEMYQQMLVPTFKRESHYSLKILKNI